MDLRSNEIQVNIFGPGIGECVVVRLDTDCWAIFDSCINPETKRSIALDYLEEQDVSFDSVVLVVATHWHDDHVSGLYQILEKCTKAKFCLSMALSREEVLQTAALYNKQSMLSGTTGIEELYSTLQLQNSRRGSVTRASANKIIYCNTNLGIKIQSLSPSDDEVERFFSSFCALFPQKTETKRVVPSISPNDASVVLMVEVKDVVLLFGADLEEHGSQTRGWTAIVESMERPQLKASMFKIPHHGSVTGHHPKIWTDLLVEKPVCLLAPYNRGRRKLPSNDDVTRIVKYSENSHTTRLSLKSKSSVRSPVVTKMIKNFNLNIDTVVLSMGHVRATFCGSQDLNWKVEHFNGAGLLSDMSR